MVGRVGMERGGCRCMVGKESLLRKIVKQISHDKLRRIWVKEEEEEEIKKTG